ncbi:uncharacterized protein LOC132721142 [Ruditapes philippinarum]|uniref:uncharacterized protein LOC132721142 n=1 Tax=Ruditapes philippinarum TaxID=129788 RepID=UPI00295BC380|nr:uncharacterized protein LOC132721142 [Ruditapes philippinarum]
MKLSEVLADIGVDERIVLKRRRTWLLTESIANIDNQSARDSLIFNFGSQSEGTTTPGMNSDLDTLACINVLPVIQDWSDWKLGVFNLLMTEDDSVSPGYCLLQVVRPDAPLPRYGESDGNFVKDKTGKLFYKNPLRSLCARYGIKIHGPAGEQKNRPGFLDKDNVLALKCTTWPLQARQWLDQQCEGHWPSDEIKHLCSRTGCLLVGVGCRGSEHEQLEWRISTSFSERLLMFNLNITQIRCYVLMKMLIKTYINPRFEDVISSFMCKTVLFHCIANTHSSIWRENNLLSCLSQCFYLLYNNIISENCPHFIIPGNNLMRGKISSENKPYLREEVNKIVSNEGEALLKVLGIKYDDLGSRLRLKFYNRSLIKSSHIISGELLFNLAIRISVKLLDTYYLHEDRSPNVAVEIFKNNISKIFNCRYEGLDKTASLLITPLYCTTLGSVLASININQYNTVSIDTLKLISLGLNTDVASSRLKLASILFRVQEIQKADVVLSEIERRYDLQIVEPVCNCYLFERKTLKQRFHELCDNHNEEVLQYITAFCVTFLPCEIHCVPTELRYEIQRSTQEERICRTERDKRWMDYAVVDSLPYLYFLQYKVNNHLGRHDEKQAALFKLVRTIKEEPHLGHRETALNILGKCMIQEGRAGDSLQCYRCHLM